MMLAAEDDFRVDASALSLMRVDAGSSSICLRDRAAYMRRAIFDPAGGPAIVREDIGRHNAVDKVVGALVLRARFRQQSRSRRQRPRQLEIVPELAAAGVPVVASVSAASSLAVDLALQMNVTLASFVRDGAMTIYAHPERIQF
jgi:FdhD protein